MEAQESFSFQPINGGSTPIHQHQKEGHAYGIEKISNETVIDSDYEEFEKMDMLWEDFNEELMKKLSSRFGSERLPELDYLEPEAAKEDGGNGAMLSARMASVVVVMKVLKKLLFLHSFRRKLKARRW